nr:uncharacterized protein LOC109183982 [Ipomoea trifida]
MQTLPLNLVLAITALNRDVLIVEFLVTPNRFATSSMDILQVTSTSKKGNTASNPPTVPPSPSNSSEPITTETIQQLLRLLREVKEPKANLVELSGNSSGIVPSRLFLLRFSMTIELEFIKQDGIFPLKRF